jgi:hypothetical protein
MTRFLGVKPFDREKPAVWGEYMRKEGVASRHKLVELFEDPQQLTHTPAFICPTNTFFSRLVVQAIIKTKECLQCSSNSLTNKE